VLRSPARGQKPLSEDGPAPRPRPGIGPTLSLRLRVSCTLRLARLPDSLVRVSRRVGWATASLSRRTPSQGATPGPTTRHPAARRIALPSGTEGPKGREPNRASPRTPIWPYVAPTGCNTAATEATTVTFPPTLSSRSKHPDAARTRREVHRQPTGRLRPPGQRQGFPHHPPATQASQEANS
jgi:hypothetical protein